MTGHTKHRSLLLYVLCAVGCGSLGGPGSSDQIPQAGVTGWTKFIPRVGSGLTAPFVLCNGFFRAPSVAVGGRGLRMWYTRVDASLGSADAANGEYDWVDRGPITLPDPGPWEAASVANGAGTWRMAAATRDRSRIAFFQSSDGTTWTATGDLLPSLAWERGSLGGPSLLYEPVGARWLLFFDGGELAIGRAISPDGLTWTEDPTPLFDAGSVLTASGWPVVGVAQPDVVVDSSRPGGSVYRMWFAGLTAHGPFGVAPDWSIGYAGSFDSASGWEVYAGDPVLAEVHVAAPGSPPSFVGEMRPSVLQEGTGWRMYYEQPYVDPVSGSTEPCVALATD